MIKGPKKKVKKTVCMHGGRQYKYMYKYRRSKGEVYLITINITILLDDSLEKLDNFFKWPLAGVLTHDCPFWVWLITVVTVLHVFANRIINCLIPVPLTIVIDVDEGFVLGIRGRRVVRLTRSKYVAMYAKINGGER